METARMVVLANPLDLQMIGRYDRLFVSCRAACQQLFVLSCLIGVAHAHAARRAVMPLPVDACMC